MKQHESFNARAKQGNVDLIFIGDSITQGWEGAGKDVWQEYAKRNAVNLGIGGDQTGHVLWRLDHGNIDGISPKLAVVMIGSNNSFVYTPEESPAESNQSLRSCGPNCPKPRCYCWASSHAAPTTMAVARSVQRRTHFLATLADNERVLPRYWPESFSRSTGRSVRTLCPTCCIRTSKAM